MSSKAISLIVASSFVTLATSAAFAEKAPLSDEALQTEAGAVVLATIEKIRIDPEDSIYEPGFGNSDWGIYLTLDIESVEKGDVPDRPLEARCFRIKSRRSAQGYLSPSGHHPIPDVGSRVRVFLEQDDGSWNVILPNGISAADESNTLADAENVTRLQSFAYTFIFPVEAWLFAALLGLPALTFFIWRWKRRHREIPESETDFGGAT